MVANMRPSLFLSLALLGCGARTSIATSESPVATACPDEPPSCERPSVACGAATLVSASCDATTHRWSCPSGSRVHARVPTQSECVPFGGLGGSFVTIPSGERCLWVAETGAARNVAYELDTDAPYGACPTSPKRVLGPIVLGETDVEQVQLTAAHRFGGETWVLYRRFRADPAAPFGVSELGTGIGRFDPVSERVRVDLTPRFGPDVDLGDASIVLGDRLYAWGCPPPIDFLTERCVVARFDTSGAMELFSGSKWIASARGSDGAEVFRAGPWLSSVSGEAGALTHLYASGFGTRIERHVAVSPEGPWSDAAPIADCRLPDDPHAFCAGPVVHPELVDPTRPAWVVSYGVGTTDPDARASRPEAYGSRLHWVDR